jgi:DNA-binding CsgD family transcriptional regulator
MKPGTIDVIEAAYRDCDSATWLRDVAAAARQQIVEGLGFVGYLYRITDEGRVAIEDYVALDAPELHERLVRASVSNAPPEYVRETFASNPCAIASKTGSAETRARTCETLKHYFGDYGLRDIFVVNGLDPTGHGVYLGGLLGSISSLSRRQHTTWSRVAAHLAAAYRLRRQLAVAEPLDTAEAILSPRGRVEHAAEPAKSSYAREMLRDAAAAIDRARTRRQRSDDSEAVQMWEALVAGRWTLIDRVDTDGRRLFIARKNDPEVQPHHALTSRERQVVGYAALGHSNKLIGYELGLSASTVSTHLAGAADKLGLGSRAALIHAATALGGGRCPLD